MARSSRLRNLFVVTAVMSSSFAVAVNAVPAEAHIGASVLQCVGTQTLDFDPPLINSPRPTRVTFTEDFSTCRLGGVSAGSGAGESSETTGCITVTVPTATATYHWETGEWSTVNWSTNAVSKLNGTIAVIAHGTVTDGLFAGATALSEVILPQPDPIACAGNGVPSVSGADTLTLVK